MVACALQTFSEYVLLTYLKLTYYNSPQLGSFSDCAAHTMKESTSLGTRYLQLSQINLVV